jgi:phosphate transport system substrate-binding protein
VKAELWSVTAAAESAGSMPDDFRVSISNAPGQSAYPIASFTWLLVPAKVAEPSKRDALLAFFHWALTDGQTMADDLSYSRLPQAVIEKAETAISHIQ